MTKRLIIISFFLGLSVVLGYLAIKTRPAHRIDASGNVTFTFNGLPPNAPVFNEHDFKPGDCYARDVVVQNNNDYAVPISVRSEAINNPDNLSSVLSLLITQGLTEIFGGNSDPQTLSQFFAASTATLEGLMLTTLPAHANATLTFKVCMPPEAGNEWQRTRLNFDLTFGRTGPDHTPTPSISPTPSPTPIPVPPECALLAGKIQHLIYGTQDHDTIHGTVENDLIYGLGGHDVLDSSGGDDCVIGGEGNDNIDTEDGHDILVGNEGDDHLKAGSGDDLVYGNNGQDQINAGSGADVVYAGASNDVIDLGDGDDLLYCGDGDDTADGKAGSDTLYGEIGNDHLSGGSGLDRLFGGPGNDQLLGGSGDDQLDGGADTDALTGNSGTDTCSLGESVNSCEL